MVLFSGGKRQIETAKEERDFMTDWLVKRFVKEYEETGSSAVRTRYGMLASVVGILCNVLLFLMKISIGLVLRSISVMADAFNNLSEAG